jgi:hypothetical protein
MPKEREVGAEIDFEEENFDEPVVPIEDEEEEFEIVSEDELEGGEAAKSDPAMEQLKLMQEQMAALSSMQGQVSGKTGSEDTAKLIEALKEMNKPKEKDFDPEMYKQKREEWSKNFYDKPLDIMDEWGQTMFGGVFQQMQQKMAALEQKITKQSLASDPKYGGVLQKYSSEVDQIANQFTGDPEAYKKAIAMVSMNHFDEILEEKLAERAGSAPEQKPKERVPYTGTTKEPTAPQPKKKNQIVLKNKAERDKFERAFNLSPMPDKKSFYELVWNRQ